MINIYKDEEQVLKDCEFIKQHTKLTTNSKVVREAINVYYTQIKEQKKQALLNRLEDLEK
jgi:hypothetical protein